MGQFHICLYLLALTLFVPQSARGEFKDEAERISYSVGYQIGGDFKSQGVELRPEHLVRGIKDALGGDTPLLTRKEMDAILIGLKRKIMDDQRAKEAQDAAHLRSVGAAFLVENGKKKGVTVLPSGVQYEVLRPGSGKKPAPDDEVTLHFRITGVDGKEMGSTYREGKPRPLSISKALPGLREVLPLMEEGSKWRVVLPTGIAAGGREPKGETVPLIYEVELLKINKPAKGVTEGVDVQGEKTPGSSGSSQ